MKPFSKALLVAALGGSLGLGTALYAVSRPMLSASAGASKKFIASETSVVDGHINTGDFLLSGGVHATDKTVLFDEECSSYSKLVGKTKINNYAEEEVSTLFSASFSIRIDDLVKDGAFSIAFGLPKVSSALSEKGVVEIRFSAPAGDPYLSVIGHYGEGVDEELLPLSPLTAFGYGTRTKVTLLATTNQKLTVTFGDTKVLDAASFREDGSGFFGFFSDGINTVSLRDFSIYGYTYDTPENVDYTEYFDDGHYNANVFYSNAQSSFLTPSYLGVDTDESGNGVLRFSKTGPAYINTRYEYSNFSTEFEVPFIQRKAEQNEDGAYTALISNWFGIAWGVQNITETTGETIAYDNWIQFEGIPVDGALHTEDYSNPRYVLWQKGRAVKIQAMEHNFFSESDAKDRTLYLKMTMVDGIFLLYQRYEGSAGYGQPVLSYDFGTTSLGTVRLFTWALTNPSGQGVAYSGVADFSIDNWNLTNLDAASVKQTIADPGYRENGIESGQNYDYETPIDSSDLLGNRVDSLSQDNASSLLGLWIGLGVGGGVLLVGGTLGGITFAKKRRTKHEN